MNQRGQVGLLPASAVNMRPQPAPVIPAQFHAPEDTLKRKSMTLNRNATLTAPGTMRFAAEEDPNDFLRRQTNIAPPVPMTLKPVEADQFSPPARPYGTLGREQASPVSPRQAPGTVRTLRPVTVHYEPDPSIPDDLVEPDHDSVRLRPVSTYYPERPLQYNTAHAEPARPTATLYPERPVEYKTARPTNDDDDDPNMKYRTARREITQVEDYDEDSAELDFTGKRRTIKKDPEPEPPAPRTPRSPRAVEPSPAPSRASRKSYDDDTGCYEQCSWNCEELFSQACWSLGRFSTKCAACVIIICLVLAGAACVGVLKFAPESRVNELWALPETNASENHAFLVATFQRAPRLNSLIVQTPGPIPTADGNASDDDETRRQLEQADNILQKRYLLDALTLHQRVIALAVTETPDEADNGNDSDSGQFAFANVCARAAVGDECRFASPLAVWRFDRTALANDADPLATLNAALPSAALEALLGGAKFELVNGTTRRLVSARALRLDYLLADRAAPQPDRDETDDDDAGVAVDFAAERWESGLLNMTREDDARQFAELQVFPNAERSLRDAIDDSIVADGLALGVSAGLVALYGIVFLGRQPLVYSRALLALGSVVMTAMAIGVMFGIASALDLFYGPLQTVLPFILLGVGVDAVYLLVAMSDEVDWSEDYVRRGEKMAAGAGLSLLYGACTTLAAFACGAISTLPAVRTFCLWALIGVTALLLLQLTFLLACTVVDSRRQKGERLDCGLCCFAECCGDNERPESKSNLKRDGLLLRYPVWFYIGKLVANPVVAVVVIVVSLVGAAVGAYGGSLLEPAVAVDRYIASDSYLNNHTQAHAAYFNATGDEVLIVSRQFDHFAKLSDLRSVLDKVLAIDVIEHGGALKPAGWLLAYTQALEAGRWGGAAAAMQSGTWHRNLTRFLNATEGAPFRSDVVFDAADPGQIAASCHTLRMRPVNGTLARADAMRKLREQLAQAVQAAGLPSAGVFAFSEEFLYLERADELADDSILHVGIAVACVVGLTLLCVTHVVPALAVAVSVLLTLGDVVGVLYLAGTDLDAVVAVVIVFSVGTSVTYAALVGRAYVWARGDRTERVREAVERVGPVVLHGALTTLLAIVVLAFRPSTVFRTFFKVMSSFLLFGAWHAVAFVPAVLALVGPRSTIQAKPNYDDAYD